MMLCKTMANRRDGDFGSDERRSTVKGDVKSKGIWSSDAGLQQAIGKETGTINWQGKKGAKARGAKEETLVHLENASLHTLHSYINSPFLCCH